MIVQRRDVFFSTKSDQGGEDKGSEHGFKKHSTSDFVFYSLGRADVRMEDEQEREGKERKKKTPQIQYYAW